MIVVLYNVLVFIQSAYILGGAYCCVKLWKLEHRWGRIFALLLGAHTIGGILALSRFGFAPRRTPIVWWPIINAIVEELVVTAGITILVLFFFGWTNGVGNFAPKAQKGNDDHP
jgi:hypothetical protein